MPIEIFISNISEDVWSFIQSMHDGERKREILENAYLSDRDILTLPAHTRNILILPTTIDPDFLSYYQTLFQNSIVDVWTPESHTGETCYDILHDKKLMSKLIKLAQKNIITMKSYSASYQFFELIGSLRQRGSTILTPESPTLKDSWTVNFFGSKSGIRQATDYLASPKLSWMAEGYISQGIDDVSCLAAHMYCRDGAIVLKTNRAHAGAGVKIFHPGDLSTSYDTCREQLKKLLLQENYWRIFPVVIEEYLQAGSSVGGGNPNCEFLINTSGKVTLLYYCGMRVSREGVFSGIEIHRDILPEKVLTQLLVMGQALGRRYAASGYRGYFDVDCVFTKDKKLFITESNIRRTGGTHVYHTAKRLMGADFMENVYILSNNTYPLLSTGKITFRDIYQKLRPLLFSPNTKEGLVIASANGFRQRTLAYVIIGRTKKASLEIEEKMELTINNY